MFCIYKLRNPYNRGEYVGHTNDYERRMYQHRYDLTVDCTDFEHEILFDNIPSRAEALEMESVFIALYDTFHNGYNETTGGGRGTEVSEETKEKQKQSALQRVADGTHNFSGDSNPVHRQVADGTHNFLGGEIAREHAHRRVEEGTHHFVGGDIQREAQRRHVESGEHHFLGGEIGGEASRQRVLDGTHNFLGGETNRRRIEDGTHHFLDGEISRQTQRQRIADGTHHFLGDNNPRRKKRLKAEWMWVRSLARCWYEMNDYVMKRRQEFYDKDIPDTSKAEQIELF